ncbi:hypothetical protein GCM10027074_46760 [Streptomyces deserti]
MSRGRVHSRWPAPGSPTRTERGSSSGSYRSATGTAPRSSSTRTSDQGIDKKAEEHAVADSPLADYGVKDVEDARLSGGLAGVIGVGVTVVAGSAVFWAVRRRRTDETCPTAVETENV